MEKTTMDREELKREARYWLERIPSYRKRGHLKLHCTFWDGVVVDVSELESTRGVTVEIDGEEYYANCSWPIAEVGWKVSGRKDELGQYWLDTILDVEDLNLAEADLKAYVENLRREDEA